MPGSAWAVGSGSRRIPMMTLNMRVAAVNRASAIGPAGSAVPTARTPTNDDAQSTATVAVAAATRNRLANVTGERGTWFGRSLGRVRRDDVAGDSSPLPWDIAVPGQRAGSDRGLDDSIGNLRHRFGVHRQVEVGLDQFEFSHYRWLARSADHVYPCIQESVRVRDGRQHTPRQGDLLGGGRPSLCSRMRIPAFVVTQTGRQDGVLPDGMEE